MDINFLRKKYNKYVRIYNLKFQRLHVILIEQKIYWDTRNKMINHLQ